MGSRYIINHDIMELPNKVSGSDFVMKLDRDYRVRVFNDTLVTIQYNYTVFYNVTALQEGISLYTFPKTQFTTDLATLAATPLTSIIETHITTTYNNYTEVDSSGNAIV